MAATSQDVRSRLFNTYNTDGAKGTCKRRVWIVIYLDYKGFVRDMAPIQTQSWLAGQQMSIDNFLSRPSSLAKAGARNKRKSGLKKHQFKQDAEGIET